MVASLPQIFTPSRAKSSLLVSLRCYPNLWKSLCYVRDPQIALLLPWLTIWLMGEQQMQCKSLKTSLIWNAQTLCILHFSREASEKYSAVNNLNSQAEKHQSVLSNPATTTGIQQILMDLLTASQNLQCQELKTPLPNGTARLYPADWLLESLLWLREAECKHSYKSHLNKCCTGKREPAQPARVSRALSAGTVHLSQVPNQLIWLLQKTLHRVPERGREKINWREKRPWTEQVILEASRIFSLDKLYDSVMI